MKRFTEYAVMCLMSATTVLNAGEAATSASAGNGWRPGSGTAVAAADYTGDGPGLARTRTRSGDLTLARGMAVGVDRDGLDFSFSHALAGRFGPAYAGTFNLSIGRDGSVSGSYGGVLSQGGHYRSAEASGATRTDPRGATATANAGGQALPTGTVDARTHSYSHRPLVYHAQPWNGYWQPTWRR